MVSVIALIGPGKTITCNKCYIYSIKFLFAVYIAYLSHLIFGGWFYQRSVYANILSLLLLIMYKIPHIQSTSSWYKNFPKPFVTFWVARSQYIVTSFLDKYTVLIAGGQVQSADSWCTNSTALGDFLGIMKNLVTFWV